MKNNSIGIYDLFRNSAEKNSDKVAITYFGINIKYKDLLSRIDTAANAFEKLNLHHGDIVALALPSTPESIITLFALNRLGIVVCNIDIRLEGEALMQAANRVNAKMLFIMSFKLKSIAPLTDKICSEHIVVMRGVESVPKYVTFWYQLGEWFNGRRKKFHSSHKFMHWEDVFRYGTPNADTSHYDWKEDECSLLFPTSGTTGGAKTVMLSDANLWGGWLSVVDLCSELKNGDISLCLLPIFSYTGFSGSIFLPLYLGMTLIIIPMWTVRDFLKLINRHRPQIVYSTPGMWNINDKDSPQDIDLSCLKQIVVCGDVIQPMLEKSINDFLHAHGCQHDITKMYGMTETCGVVSYTPSNYENKYTLGYSGLVVQAHEVAIVDDEVCVCPKKSFLGYYGDPEATNNLYRQHADGRYWIHTGDIGYFDHNGHLYVIGRKKRMIVTHNGSKVFPIEIESALMKHPNVADCAVIAINDPSHISCSLPKAFVQVVGTSKSAAHKLLSKYCNQHLPEHLRPASIIIVNIIPKNSNGKTDYAALMRM